MTHESAHPPLFSDRAFWGMTITQFLGALNDNIFKQLVLFLCLDAFRAGGTDRQGTAQILFAIPFILGSGGCGFIADRWSKRTIVVGCKIAEVVIASLGMLSFALMSSMPQWGLTFPLAVVFLMGAHSTVFGPAKFGILPELFDDRDLPKANGIVLMTTFLAIIVAFPIAGGLKMLCEKFFEGQIWMASGACLLVASLGVATSLLIRRTPVARPDLKFEPASLFIHPTTWRAMVTQQGLMTVAVVLSIFWLTGGLVYPPVTNAVGKIQLGLNDLQTGMLAAATGVGILVGCLVAGWLSHNRFNAKLVRVGGWGMLVSLLALSLPGSQIVEPAPANVVNAPVEAGVGVPPVDAQKAVMDGPQRQPLLGIAGIAIALVGVGFFAGMFTVPLQVFLQAKSPLDQKGRVIGVMNLFNWVGIALSGQIYNIFQPLIVTRFKAPINTMYICAAAVLVPVLIFYRPKDESLDESLTPSQ
jgi:hypothetical protein